MFPCFLINLGWNFYAIWMDWRAELLSKFHNKEGGFHHCTKANEFIIGEWIFVQKLHSNGEWAGLSWKSMGRLFQSCFLLHVHGQDSSSKRVEWLGWPKARLVSTIQRSWNSFLYTNYAVKGFDFVFDFVFVCVCVAGEYIMENTSAVGQGLTWLEECHGQGCLRTKRPSLLLGFNSFKGTLGSFAPLTNRILLSPIGAHPSLQSSLISIKMMKMEGVEIKWNTDLESNYPIPS